MSDPKRPPAPRARGQRHPRIDFGLATIPTFMVLVGAATAWMSRQRSDPLTPKMHPFASGDTTDSASLALFPAKAEVSISF